MTEQLQSAEICWAVEEFGQVDLKDERLNFRCQELVEALGQQPSAPINQACEDWADIALQKKNLEIGYGLDKTAKIWHSYPLDAHF